MRSCKCLLPVGVAVPINLFNNMILIYGGNNFAKKMELLAASVGKKEGARLSNQKQIFTKIAVSSAI